VVSTWSDAPLLNSHLFNSGQRRAEDDESAAKRRQTEISASDGNVTGRWRVEEQEHAMEEEVVELMMMRAHTGTEAWPPCARRETPTNSMRHCTDTYELNASSQKGGKETWPPCAHIVPSASHAYDNARADVRDTHELNASSQKGCKETQSQFAHIVSTASHAHDAACADMRHTHELNASSHEVGKETCSPFVRIVSRETPTNSMRHRRDTHELNASLREGGKETWSPFVRISAASHVYDAVCTDMRDTHELHASSKEGQHTHDAAHCDTQQHAATHTHDAAHMHGAVHKHLAARDGMRDTHELSASSKEGQHTRNVAKSSPPAREWNSLPRHVQGNHLIGPDGQVPPPSPFPHSY